MELGQRVRVTRVLAFAEAETYRWGRTYTSAPITPVEGVVTGRRYVQDGHVESEDGYRYYVPNGKSTGYWLVTFDMRRNPLKATDDGIEAL